MAEGIGSGPSGNHGALNSASAASRSSRSAALPGTRDGQTAVTEEEVETFLNSLRRADVDKKVNLIQLWGIKLESVDALPERTIDAITIVVGPFLRSPSHLLLTSTISSFLPVFLPLVPANVASHLRLALTQLLPGLIEKLGDPKEKVHSFARECVVCLGRKVYEGDIQSLKGKQKEGDVGIWETAVKEALSGRSARAKMECLKSLLEMRSDTSIKVPLKPWLPVLVDLLEDSDGTVRDNARETVIAMLAPPSTPAAARTQLKTLMVARGVRKSIADAIISRVLGGSVEPVTDITTKAEKSEPLRSGHATPAEDVEVVYIASSMDLQNEFRAMIPHFAGKETEHNWGPRERAIMRVRGMLRGRVFSNHPDAFLVGLKGDMTEGIGKTLVSLRTTVAQQSCALVQELAEYLGPSVDNCAEALLPILGKMAGLTKRIIADKSQAAVTAIYKHSAIAPKALVSHAAAAINDKSVQSRQYGLAHLRTFLEFRASGSKAVSVESIPGLAKDIEQLLRRGLGDTNPQVREQGRQTFWSFNRVWPREGTALLESLDGVARKQLEKVNPGLAGKAVEAKPIPKKPRASSAMAALLAAKRAEAAQLAGQRSKTASPQDELLPTSPEKSKSNLPPSQDIGNLGAGDTGNNDDAAREQCVPAEKPSVVLPQHVGRDEFGESQTSIKQLGHTKETTSTTLAPADVQVDGNTLPVSPGLQEHSERTPAPRTTSPQPSPPSSTSRSPPARTLSHSPPSNSEPQHFHRSSDRSMVASDSVAHFPHTPVRSLMPKPKAHKLSTATPLQNRRPFAERSLTSAALLSQQTPGDAVEEARRAQAAQGISAAEQLLDYDDDEQQVAMQPMTPLRHPIGASFTTPLPSRLQRQVWEDSPKAVTPKLMKQLQSRPHERSWWNERRSLLKEAAPSTEDISIANVQEDIRLLAEGRPTVENFRRLAMVSSIHSIDPTVHSEMGLAIWSEDNTFDRLFLGLIDFLSPNQPVQLLEHALVVLWELVRNQWPLIESREDCLLDALFRLRTSSNMIVLESTNALISLLTDVCDPPFLLLLLHAALDRFHVGLAANDPASQGDVSGERAKAAGYNYGLNAMGMCIIRLPKEAVETEASRLEPHVMKALGLVSQDCVPARQAANRVILSIQCMLEDDTRTLALFPSLDKKQRAFVTYQMEQNGILYKGAGSPPQTNSGRETMHHELVDGMARGSRVAR